MQTRGPHAAAGVPRVGTAGWQLPRPLASRFAAPGSRLARYATRMSAVEINSSFYRPHARATYERWAAEVPTDFRFAVKLPRALTHAQRLAAPEALLDAFLAQVGGLGARLGCLLVQLPPSLPFDAAVARHFLVALRRRHAGPVALEPRHASWFAPAADALLARHQVARVLADPQRHPAGTDPGGWPGLVYLRLHGSPRVYRDAYARDWLRRLAARMALARADGQALWCIFDNTAAGHALGDALALQAALQGPHGAPARRLDPHGAQTPEEGPHG